MSKSYFSDHKLSNDFREGMKLFSAIQVADKALKRTGYPAIPEDYKDLLLNENGMQVGIISLYGVDIPDAEEDKNDILTATLKVADEETLNISGLVLGCIQGDATIMYSGDDSRYHVVDNTTGDSIASHATLDDLIKEWTPSQKTIFPPPIRKYN